MTIKKTKKGWVIEITNFEFDRMLEHGGVCGKKIFWSKRLGIEPVEVIIGII